MSWIQTIFQDPGSIAHLVVIYALVISLGVKLGRIKFGGVALGVTFVLFAGILLGHIYYQFIPDTAFTCLSIASACRWDRASSPPSKKAA